MTLTVSQFAGRAGLGPDTVRSYESLPRGVERALEGRWKWLEYLRRGERDVRLKALQDLEDTGRTEESIRQSYTGRYGVELLQNAHDACADAGRVGAVRFVVTSTALLVANEGQPFDHDRILSLVRLGSSDKRSRRGLRRAIGYKGIGFTSVFEVSDSPQVVTSDFAFGFDRDRAAARVIDALGQVPARLPARYFPLILTPNDWADDADQVDTLLSDGAVTVIRLPFRGARTADSVLADIEASLTPEILLFMPWVETLGITSSSGSHSWKRSTGRRIGPGRVVKIMGESGGTGWLFAESREPVSAELTSELGDELWEGLRRLNVAVALPWTRGGIDGEAVPRAIHVYFPTDDKIGRGLLIHGDFYVDRSRRRIETKGEGGQISMVVGRAAAKLAGRLAEAVASQGRRLLSSLAESQPPDGFGSVMSKLLDEALRTAKIVRRASDLKAVTVTDVKRLATKAGAPMERKLVRLLRDSRELLLPGDDEGSASKLLAGLGMDEVDPVEVARGLDVMHSNVDSEEAAPVIAKWFSELEAEWQVTPILKKAKFLKDIDGRWCSPQDAFLRLPNSPSLPAGIDRKEIARPRRSDVRDLLETLDVQALDVSAAVGILISEILSSRRFGSTRREATEVLNFLREVWRLDRAAIKEKAGRLGAVNLPVRATMGDQMELRAARDTYFGSNWEVGSVAERIYGPLGESEFLAVSPPRSAGARKVEREFFATLGVTSLPRPRATKQLHEHDRYWSWRQTSEFQDAFRCPEGHDPSRFSVQADVLEQLESLLERASADPSYGAALALGLLDLNEPLGSEAEIRCNHGHHRRRTVRKTRGYQRWLLETTAWVPVTNDPLGRSTRAPGDAWVDLPRAKPWLMIARAALPPDTGHGLGLVTTERPATEALERALDDLERAAPDLEDAATDLIDTAKWLLQKLDRAILARRGGVQRPSVPPMPARNGGRWEWSRGSRVADLPGSERLPGLPLLPPGDWKGLRKGYELALASECVDIVVEPGPPRRLARLLNWDRKAELLALLDQFGVDMPRAAGRLARLKEHHVDSLRVTARLDDSTIAMEPDHYLNPSRDSRGRVLGSDLYVTQESRKYEVSRTLAAYLGEPERAGDVASFLQDPDVVLAVNQISDDDIMQAREVLQRHRRAARVGEELQDEVQVDPEQEEPDADLEEGVVIDFGADEEDGVQESQSSPESPSSRRVSRSSDAPQLLDPAAARFGTPRSGTLEAPKTRLLSVGVGATGSTRPSSGRSTWSSDPSINREVEKRAVELVTRYGEEELGLRVVDVQDQSLGWDLEFYRKDGSWDPVEVKGSAGRGAFIITRNELRAAREHANYVLYLVSHLASPAEARMIRFPGVGEGLASAELEPVAWIVRWDVLGLTHEVIPVGIDLEDA